MSQIEEYQGRNARHYRNIRTSQERRMAADPEMSQFVRGARSLSNLPNSWDDVRPGGKKVYTHRQIARTRRGFRDNLRNQEVIEMNEEIV